MAVLRVDTFTDRAVSLNWADDSLVMTYGDAEVLRVQHEAGSGSYRVRVCVRKDETKRIAWQRIIEVVPVGDGYKPLVSVLLRTGRTPILDAGERDCWGRGLAPVKELAEGRANPSRDGANHVNGPWLAELFPAHDPPARFTARGTLERFGEGQWNVLVENVGEMVRFWKEHKIETKLDWAGMFPPKATVGRRELVARCDAAGEGARVEYEIEVQDRGTGRGVTGADLRVLAPRQAEGETLHSEPEGPTFFENNPRTAGKGLGFDEVVARLVAEGGHPGKTATAAGPYYATASKLRYVPCRCSWDDSSYGCREYVAKTPRGTRYYISHNLKTGLISCGPKGYHFCRPDVPECI